MIDLKRSEEEPKRQRCPNEGKPCFCTGVCLRREGALPPARSWVDIENERDRKIAP